MNIFFSTGANYLPMDIKVQIKKIVYLSATPASIPVVSPTLSLYSTQFLQFQFSVSLKVVLLFQLFCCAGAFCCSRTSTWRHGLFMVALCATTTTTIVVVVVVVVVAVVSRTTEQQLKTKTPCLQLKNNI